MTFGMYAINESAMVDDASYTQKYSVIKNCCPICGHEFEVICDINKCPQCGEITRKDKLITEDDDYLWVD